MSHTITKKSFKEFPVEIITKILALICIPSSSDGLSLVLTCKGFQQLAPPSFYSEVRIRSEKGAKGFQKLRYRRTFAARERLAQVKVLKFFWPVNELRCKAPKGGEERTLDEDPVPMNGCVLPNLVELHLNTANRMPWLHPTFANLLGPDLNVLYLNFSLLSPQPLFKSFTILKDVLRTTKVLSVNTENTSLFQCLQYIPSSTQHLLVRSADTWKEIPIAFRETSPAIEIGNWWMMPKTPGGMDAVFMEIKKPRVIAGRDEPVVNELKRFVFADATLKAKERKGPFEKKLQRLEKKEDLGFEFEMMELTRDDHEEMEDEFERMKREYEASIVAPSPSQFPLPTESTS